MKLGISTSCLYPDLTEQAICRIAKFQPQAMEIFLNTYSETTPQFAKKMKEILDFHGVEAVSVHPFTSGMESLLFFSEYKRRMVDGINRYKELYFDFLHQIGAKILVLHGCHTNVNIENSMYFDRFAEMRECARKEGIILAQENVAPFKSHSIEFIKDMKQYLNGNVEFVLDVKQTVRAEQNIWDMIDIMGKNIVHLHLSDHDHSHDCLPIGKGDFDFKALFARLKQCSFDGSGVIELYRNNFKSTQELFHSYQQVINFSK